MSDIATALEGLLDANLDEIEKIHIEDEWEKQRRVLVADFLTELEDEIHQKLKSLRELLLADADKRCAAHEARVLRLNGQEPPPADVVRFPKSQKLAAE
jgi:hypothetical protein